jgi:hypothetical protein
VATNASAGLAATAVSPCSTRMPLTRRNSADLAGATRC